MVVCRHVGTASGSRRGVYREETRKARVCAASPRLVRRDTARRPAHPRVGIARHGKTAARRDNRHVCGQHERRRHTAQAAVQAKAEVVRHTLSRRHKSRGRLCNKANRYRRRQDHRGTCVDEQHIQLQVCKALSDVLRPRHARQRALGQPRPVGHTRNLLRLRPALHSRDMDAHRPQGALPPPAAQRHREKGNDDLCAACRHYVYGSRSNNSAQGDGRQVRTAVCSLQQPRMPAANSRHRLHEEAVRQRKLRRLHGRTGADGLRDVARRVEPRAAAQTEGRRPARQAAAAPPLRHKHLLQRHDGRIHHWPLPERILQRARRRVSPPGGRRRRAHTARDGPAARQAAEGVSVYRQRQHHMVCPNRHHARLCRSPGRQTVYAERIFADISGGAGRQHGFCGQHCRQNAALSAQKRRQLAALGRADAGRTAV